MRLGKMLSTYMLEHHHSFRSLAKEIGCDHTTLYRLAEGKPCRLDTLIKVLLWLFS